MPRPQPVSRHSALEEARIIMSRPSVAMFFAEAGNHPQSPPRLSRRPLSVDSAIARLSMFISGNDSLVDSPLPMSSSNSQYGSEVHLDAKSAGNSSDPRYYHKSYANINDRAGITRQTRRRNSLTLGEVSWPTSWPTTPEPSHMPLPASRSVSISSASSHSDYRESRISQNSSSDADISSNGDPFISPKPTPRYRRPRKNRRALDEGTITLGDVSGYDLMSRMTYFRPYTTLHQFINFIIENDIILPTDEEINGDREWNAAECEYAASIPLEPRPFFTKEDKDFLEFCRANPGRCPPSGNDLGEIGARALYYTDPLTGKIKKHVGRFDPMDPRHLVNVAAARAAEQEKATEEEMVVKAVAEERKAEKEIADGYVGEEMVDEAAVDEIEPQDDDCGEEEDIMSLRASECIVEEHQRSITL
ncbi:MAG: hypothetical protein Q9225_000583 [Loekoesia sp. 1 TL-2023]